MKALGFDLPKSELIAILTTYGVPSLSAAAAASSTNSNPSQHQHQYQQYPPTKLQITLDTFQPLMAQRILARDPRDEILRAFALFDDGDKGVIRLEDVRRVARELGEGLEEEELVAMIEEFDLDGDGGINRDEFIAICLQ